MLAAVTHGAPTILVLTPTYHLGYTATVQDTQIKQDSRKIVVHHAQLAIVGTTECSQFKILGVLYSRELDGGLCSHSVADL